MPSTKVEAAIQFVGSTTNSGTNASYNLSLTALSGGISSTAAENDFVIVVNTFAGTADGTPGVGTAGYTEMTNLYVNSTYDTNFSVNYKFMTATPDTTVSCNGASGEGGEASTCVAMVFRGVNLTTPLDVASTTDVSGGGGQNDNIDCPIITPVTSGSYVVCTGGAAGSSVDTDIPAIGGYTHAYRQAVSTNAAASVAAYKAVTHLQGEDPLPFSLDLGTDSNNSWAALSMVLREQPAPLTLSGTLYSDEGVTPITSSKTIAIAVSTTTVSRYSTTTNASGQWTITIPAGHAIGPTVPITVFVDGDGATRASLVTKTNSSADISGLNLYQNRVIISHEGTEATTLDDMVTYNNSDDSDIQFEAVNSDGTSGNIFAGNKLYINTGKTFSPGGNLTIYANAGASSVDGDLHVASGATYDQGEGVGGTTYNTILGGTLTASATATIINNGILTFKASTTGKSINATQALGNVAFENTASMSFATSATTTNLTINTGATVVLPAATLTVLGNYTNNGTSTHNGGTIIFASTTKEQNLSGTLTGTSSLGNLRFVGNSTSTPSGLIGKWNLDENSGTIAYDSSGNGNNGTLTNGPTWKEGKVGRAVDLDGADDYITVGSPSLLDNITQKTITAWINPTSLGDSNYGRIVDKNAGASDGWLYYLSNTDCVSCLRYNQTFSGGSGYWNTGNNTITVGANAWQHIAMTYDSSSATNDAVFYINGVLSPLLYDVNTTGTATSDAANSWVFGDRPAGDRSFNGDMDDLRIYNRVLTATEIATIYNERPKFITAHASTTNLSIDSGVVALSSTSLSIAGNYTNSGSFAAGSGTTTFSGTSAQTATGTMTGSSAFRNLTITNSAASTTFTTPLTVSGKFTATTPGTTIILSTVSTTTLATAEIVGSSTQSIMLRSTTPGTQSPFAVEGAYTLSYLNVKDSYACRHEPLSGIGLINGGNNNCWEFTTGTSTLANHDDTQVNNAFSFQNVTNEALFAFKLTPESGNATVTALTVSILGATKVNASDFSNLRLFRDHDADGQYDAADTSIGGAGVLSITGQTGTITFTTDFLATTSENYLVVSDWVAPQNGSYLRLALPTTGVVMIDETGSQAVVGSVSTIQHNRNNKGGVGSGSGGGSGSQAAIGSDTPAGQGTVGGGIVEGGGGVGDQEVPGEQIGDPVNYKWPTAHSGVWNNAAYAYDRLNSTHATTSTISATSSFRNHSFGVPGGNVITGVEVKLEVSASTADGDIGVNLSWDGGTSWTTQKTTPTLTTSDVIATLGGPADAWGRTWSAADFSNANFAVRLTSNSSEPSSRVQVDALVVRVYHQAGGGGAGGGGGI